MSPDLGNAAAREARARKKIREKASEDKSTRLHEVHTITFQPRGAHKNEDRLVTDRWDIQGRRSRSSIIRMWNGCEAELWKGDGALLPSVGEELVKGVSSLLSCCFMHISWLVRHYVLLFLSYLLAASDGGFLCFGVRWEMSRLDDLLWSWFGVLGALGATSSG